MELTRLRGRKVVDDTRARVGHVSDVVARVDRDTPLVVGLVVGARGAATGWVPWGAVVEFDEDAIAVGARPIPVPAALHGIRLVRDVLDVQVYDVHGKRFARVGDVRLARSGGDLVVVGLELGLGAVLRRLHLGWVTRGSGESPVDWRGVRLTPGRGHALRMLTASAERLAPSEMAELLAHLPADRGADVLDDLSASEAAAVLSHSRPRLGARIVGSLRPGRAAGILGAMPPDDAAATLRHLSPVDLDRLLAHVVTERADELRRLLAHPVTTAAGLMNTQVVTVQAGATRDEVMAAVRDAVPRLDALMTVFVLDGDRLVGAITPRELVLGRFAPAAVATLAPQTPIEVAIDHFALHDVLAVPVVDEAGRLLGAVAVDDILEEVLAERLPGGRRYRGVRRRRRR